MGHIECTEDYHINILGPLDGIVKEDMHCPHVGSLGNNFSRANCLERQKNPDHIKTCFPHCKCKDKDKSKPPRPKTITPTTYTPKTKRKGTLREAIVKLHKQKLTGREIADKLGLDNVKKVHDHLHKARRFGEI